jgi:hypothetical protein
LDATYLLTDSVLTVSANLTPRVGRVRFTGTPKDSIWLTGLITHTKYDFNNNRFVTSTAVKCDTVMNTGSTDYIYASFADTTKMAIGLLTTEDAFTRYCKSEMLNPGVSGYMAVPSRESRNQWANGLVLTANGVEFTMIAVPGYSGGHYCIAETETTLELYNKVIDATSTTTSQKPVSVSLYYSDIATFINKLTSLIGTTFSIPTASQWTFAAQGGNRSKGYTYSGSNTISDVAWYSGNATERQTVKQKIPNELGIYDMSGNVHEWVSDISNGYHCCYGGSYLSSAGNCIPTYCSYANSSNGSIGFRFIMPY